MDGIALGVATQVSSRELRVSSVRGVWTRECANVAQRHCASTAAASAVTHPDYALLGGRLYVAGLHKDTQKSFTDWVTSYGTGTLEHAGTRK